MCKQISCDGFYRSCNDCFLQNLKEDYRWRHRITGAPTAVNLTMMGDSISLEIAGETLAPMPRDEALTWLRNEYMTYTVATYDDPYALIDRDDD